MECKKRISKFTKLINVERNASEIGENVRKNTEKIIGYIQKNGVENMYEGMEEYINKRKLDSMKKIEGQNTGYIAGYSREERTTDGFGIGEIEY